MPALQVPVPARAGAWTPWICLKIGYTPNSNVLSSCQWEFQDPKLEVPTMYKAYFLGLCKGISQQNMILYGTVILKFPLIMLHS